MIPEGNNVYGAFVAPEGLEPILQAVQQALAEGGASIYRSQRGDAALRLRSQRADFDSEPLKGAQHLFNGAVAGSLEEVICFARELSESMSRAGIEHSFEVYDGQRLVERMPS